MLPIDIVVFGDGSLFDEGVSNLLSVDARLNVFRILYTDDSVLDQLVRLDNPEVIFLNEFDARDTDRIVRLIFSVPSVFVRCVVVAHLENNTFDVYNRLMKKFPSEMYQWQSIVVKSKEELINLARLVCRFT